MLSANETREIFPCMLIFYLILTVVVIFIVTLFLEQLQGHHL